jgi:hypothetical protein
MGTRAYICKTIDDVNCVGIYCQLDGGLNHTGRLLVADYQKGRKVNELLAKGDLLWLGKFLSPSKNKSHSFNTPQRNVSLFFCRDGNKVKKDLVAFNLSELDDETNMLNFVYVFRPGLGWFYFRPGKLSEGLIHLA